MYFAAEAERLRNPWAGCDFREIEDKMPCRMAQLRKADQSKDRSTVPRPMIAVRSS